jgi:hypothetical protein
VRDLHASRLVEPIDGLNRIAAAAARAASTSGRYPDSAPLTPRNVPSGAPTLDPPGAWEHPTWVSLGFAFERPHSYSFEFESERRGRRSKYVATAQGDLDGDGQLSEFSIRGDAVEGRAEDVPDGDAARSGVRALGSCPCAIAGQRVQPTCPLWPMAFWARFLTRKRSLLKQGCGEGDVKAASHDSQGHRRAIRDRPRR